jgi:hypothetical protein
MSMSLFRALVSFLLVFSLPIYKAHAENDTQQHEIEYGFVNLNTFSFIDMDWSEFPLFGASYTYYFSPIDPKSNDQPYEMQGDSQRISWLKVDLNAFMAGPNIAGNYYINDQWNFEFDLQSIEEDYNNYGNSSYTEQEVFADLLATYKLNKHWSIGLSYRYFSESSERLDIVDDYVDDINLNEDNVSLIAIEGRYTNIQDNQGWDIKYSLSDSFDNGSGKIFATYYSSKKNAITTGLVYANMFDDDYLLSLSFAHKHWYTKNKFINYGVSYISFEGEYIIGFFDFSGGWRF